MYKQIFDAKGKVVEKVSNYHGNVIITFKDKTFLYFRSNTGIEDQVEYDLLLFKLISIDSGVLTPEEYDKLNEKRLEAIKEKTRQNKLRQYNKLKKELEL